jgi:CBS domain-containing protein
MVPAKEIKTLSSKESAYDALKKLEMQGLNLLPVIEKGKVKGVITRSKITHYLALEVKYGIEG